MSEIKQEDNIIQFKPKKPPIKKIEWKLPKHFWKIILGSILVIAVWIISCFQIKNMEVEGERYYSKDEIKAAVKADCYIPNSILLKMRNRIVPIKTMPFVEKVNIAIIDRNTVRIEVTEKIRAGCVKYSGKYLYFDKEGRILEADQKRLKAVPLITGITVKEMQMGELLIVDKKDEKKFAQIVKITTLITKNNLTIREIEFREDGNIILKKGKLLVELGNGKNLDMKLSKLSGIFKSLKGQSGTVYMNIYTPENKIITYKPKK